MKERLRHLWHELYYKLSPPSGVDFALTCRQAVERIDLDSGLSWRERLRLRLHLSLCQACSYYFRASRALGHAIRQMVDDSPESVDLEKVRKELLQKYTRSKDSP